MSEADHSVDLGGFDRVDTVPEVLSTAPSQPVQRPVVRLTEELRMHPALEELGLIGVVDEINEAAALKERSPAEPILVTDDGTVLAGWIDGLYGSSWLSSDGTIDGEGLWTHIDIACAMEWLPTADTDVSADPCEIYWDERGGLKKGSKRSETVRSVH